MKDHNATFAKAAARLLPFMGLLYLVSFLDRVNAGFAALTMNKDLGLSPEVYGFGAGIFFFGYFLFEVPSNIILQRVGARLWICRIMVTWGVVSMAMALARGPQSFYALRFLLGVAEAGFTPGMLLYLTYWFPQEIRSRYAALYFTAIPLASVIGAPLSGFILGMDGLAGLHGWQWLFILEGLPACLLGIVVLFALPNRPADVNWLSDAEKSEIESRLSDAAESRHTDLWAGLGDLRVLMLSLVYFGIVVGLYGVGLWLPQIVKGMGYSTVETGFVVAAPYAVSVLVMILWGRSSDAFGERVWHVALAAIFAAGGLIVAATATSDLVALAGLACATIGINASLAPFWSLPTIFLGGTAAAGGIALINAVGNLGGFLGPYLVGWVKKATGLYAAGMGAMAICLIAAAVIVLLLARSLTFKGRARALDRYAPP